MAPIDTTMTDLPVRGRRFSGRRMPGLGDAGPDAVVRLDALARLLQDIASADSDDSGIDPVWVLRRTTVVARRWPVLGEHLDLTTFCSGVGPRWAGRRTRVVGDRGAFVDSDALWVYVDRDGRPAPLPASFGEFYGEAAGGRALRAKLRHGPPSGSIERRPWSLRHADLDVMGHVNNAASLEAVVDEVARWLPGRAIAAAEVEYPVPLDLGDRVEVQTRCDPDGVAVWLVVDDQVRVSAVVEVR